MIWLEHRLPPPLVGLLTGLLMWGLAPLGPALPVADVLRTALSAGLFLIGLGFDVLGIFSFIRRRTTVNPLHPERASTLVTDGIYRVTRNPMYVGMLWILTGWAVQLSAALPWLGPILYISYVTRFQILPEERILRERFGAPYRDYCRRVRRWL